MVIVRLASDYWSWVLLICKPSMNIFQDTNFKYQNWRSLFFIKIEFITLLSFKTRKLGKQREVWFSSVLRLTLRNIEWKKPLKLDSSGLLSRRATFMCHLKPNLHLLFVSGVSIRWASLWIFSIFFFFCRIDTTYFSSLVSCVMHDNYLIELRVSVRLHFLSFKNIYL